MNMKSKAIIIASAVIGIAIVILGLSLKSAFDNFTNRDRIVTVRGLCEKEVMANKVTWPIVTKEMGNDLPGIYNKIQSTNAAIVAFLKENGLTDNEISVNPPQVFDKAVDRYNDQPLASRYQVTNVVVVTSDKVEAVRKLIDKQTQLLQKGIAVVAGDWNYQTTYEYTDLNSIKPEMIAEATANARQAADKFAADSHSKLGKIKTASQGQFSIADRDQYTPNVKTVRVVTSITYYLED
ncbi:MAG: SIMPL domain-containing protein [Bacteroidales bacterium]|nr:SIMPL domain-containing protein [Bacteroidales bacterium]